MTYSKLPRYTRAKPEISEFPGKPHSHPALEHILFRQKPLNCIMPVPTIPALVEVTSVFFFNESVHILSFSYTLESSFLGKILTLNQNNNKCTKSTILHARPVPFWKEKKHRSLFPNTSNPHLIITAVYPEHS